MVGHHSFCPSWQEAYCISFQFSLHLKVCWDLCCLRHRFQSLGACCQHRLTFVHPLPLQIYHPDFSRNLCLDKVFDKVYPAVNFSLSTGFFPRHNLVLLEQGLKPKTSQLNHTHKNAWRTFLTVLDWWGKITKNRQFSRVLLLGSVHCISPQ